MLPRLISFVFLLTLSVSFQLLPAQSPPDSIQVINVAKGQFQYKEATLDLKQLLHVTTKNPEAYHAISRAIKQRQGSMILGGIGGAMVGYTLGSAIGSGDPTWWVAGVGVGIIGISAILSGESKSNARRGVALHNAALKDQNQPRRAPVRLGMSSNGIRVSWQF